MNSLKCSYLKETINSCLWESCECACKIYRTDGITQSSSIEQLFANYYRTEPYEFITHSEHDDALNTIDAYFSSHSEEFEFHISKNHGEPIDELKFENDCEENCICYALGTISDCIKEYANGVRLEMLVNEDSEIIEKILSVYNNYTDFVVLAETKLPSISKLLGKIPSKGYPFSLWKFLYKQFIEQLLIPIEDELMQILVRGIAKVRRDSIKEALAQRQNLSYEIFDRICQLHEIASIIAVKSLDERSVHFLESSENRFIQESYIIIEEMINSQTGEIYAEFNYKENKEINWKTIVSSDIEALEKILLAYPLKDIVKNCIEVAKNMWGYDTTHINCRFEIYNMKDTLVNKYVKKLGILVNS